MKLAKLSLALGLGLAASGAFAQSTANMQVSASITGSCSVVANPLAFSAYDPAAATPLRVNTTTVITCSTGAGASIGMGPGANLSGTGLAAVRRMRVGTTANYLNYSIYQPADGTAGAACEYTTTWGNGTAAGNVLTIAAAPSGTARTYNVCGEIPAGQTSAIGSYVDTVQVIANL
jgi:spore coat protein U-like protein